MSSINLLPRNNTKEEREKRAEKHDNIPMLLSFLLIIIVSSSVAGLYFYNQLYIKKNSSLREETKKIDQSLEEATKNNELLLIETMAKDDSFLLSTHPYFSRVIDFIQNNLENEVFLSSVKIKEGPQNVNISLEANTKDYLSIASQISILKRAELVESVGLGNISTDDGIYVFPISINLNKKVIFESDQDGSGEREENL